MLRIAPPRVGLVAVGPPDAQWTWSGTPFGVLSGLESLGVDVVAIDVDPPSRLEEPLIRAVRASLRDVPRSERRTVARNSVTHSRLYSLMGRRKLKSAGHLDGVIQLSSTFFLAHHNLVTFDDMTLVQAARHRFELWSHLPDRIVASRIRLQARTYRHARGCAAATSWVRDSIEDDYGIPPSKLTVTGLGYKDRLLPDVPRDWRSPTFLFVGRHWERKGGPAVIQAFQEVRAHHPSATLHVVGCRPGLGADGVVEHGIMRLEDPEDQTELGLLFATSTCLVVPSDIEPAGLVYVEAARAGMPSIGTSVGGASDMIGPAGVVVTPRDVRGLTEAMLNLARPDVAQSLGQLGPGHASTFEWRNVALHLMEALGLSVAADGADPTGWPSQS